MKLVWMEGWRVWIASPRRKILAVGSLAGIALAAAAVVWAGFQAATPAPSQLTAMLPQGALLTIEAKDFAGQLKRWNDSPEQAAWIRSDNFSVFSRSRLFGRLGDAQKEFAQAAGLPPDMSFLNEVAGQESVFAWYDIGKLEFLYLTRMPSGSADRSRLVEMRGKFSARQAGGQTFYVRTVGGNPQDGAESLAQPRTVAFATGGDWLMLATREDLMAGALTLMAAHGGGSNSPGQAAAFPSLAEEPWFTECRAAAAKEPGELRMTLNLEKIVKTPYFRSYWIQENVSEMKQFRGAVADLYLGTGTFREERVLLPVSPADRFSSAADLEALTGLLPAHAGVFRAVATPSVDAAVGSVDEKLLARATGNFSDSRVAPQAEVSVQTAGSADLEAHIDAAPLVRPAAGAQLVALRKTLEDAGLDGMMTVSRTGMAQGNSTDGPDTVWVPFQSAVVLSAGKDWDAAVMQAALREALAAHLTASGMGLDWKPVKRKTGTYFEISQTRPLEMAVRGRICILSDSPDLMEEMLGRLSGAAKSLGHGKKSGSRDSGSGITLIAGFNLAQESAAFARWSKLVDRTNAGAASGANGDAPAFFSRNMLGLSEVFAPLESERVVETRDAALTRQTVTYAWRQ